MDVRNQDRPKSKGNFSSKGKRKVGAEKSPNKSSKLNGGWKKSPRQRTGEQLATAKRKDNNQSLDDAQSWKRSKQMSQPTKKILPTTHKEQKELRKQRKAESNPNFTLISELKLLWEKARPKQLSTEQRLPIVKDMFKIAKGHMHDHDSARIVQFLVRHGDTEIRASVFEELGDHMLRLCKTNFSRFIVQKLLRFGTRSQRDAIISKFFGSVRKLIRQKFAADVLATAYADYATAQQRLSLVQEFYGPQFALFKSKNEKTLDSFASKNPEKMPLVIETMKKTLEPMLEKGICEHQIVHRVLLDFLLHAPEQQRADMIDTIKELVVEMLHTREGSRVTLITLKYSNTKDRKIILRSFRPYIEKIALAEFGHLALMGACDVVDDTVLLKKTLLQDIAKTVETLANDAYGRKLLLYLVAHRSKMHFTPAVLSQMEDLDNNPFSKKRSDVRRKEILDAISPALIDLVANQAASLSRTGQTALLIAEILSHCEGNKINAYRALSVEAITKEDPLFEHPAGHKLLKTLAHVSDTESSAPFASTLLEAIDSGNAIERMLACNRGAFVLLSLVESSADCTALVAEIKAAAIQLADSDDELSPGLRLLLKTIKNLKPQKMAQVEQRTERVSECENMTDKDTSKDMPSRSTRKERNIKKLQTEQEDGDGGEEVDKQKGANEGDCENESDNDEQNEDQEGESASEAHGDESEDEGHEDVAEKCIEAEEDGKDVSTKESNQSEVSRGQMTEKNTLNNNSPELAGDTSSSKSPLGVLTRSARRKRTKARMVSTHSSEETTSGADSLKTPTDDTSPNAFSPIQTRASRRRSQAQTPAKTPRSKINARNTPAH